MFHETGSGDAIEAMSLKAAILVGGPQKGWCIHTLAHKCTQSSVILIYHIFSLFSLHNRRAT